MSLAISTAIHSPMTIVIGIAILSTSIRISICISSCALCVIASEGPSIVSYSVCDSCESSAAIDDPYISI